MLSISFRSWRYFSGYSIESAFMASLLGVARSDRAPAKMNGREMEMMGI